MTLTTADPVHEERAALESPVRRAFLRAILVAVAFAAVFAVVQVSYLVATGASIGRKWLEPLLVGLMIGSVAGPTALVELWARRLAPGWRRDLVAALAVALVALPLMAIAALQATYTVALAETGTPWTAWRAVRSLGHAMTREPVEFARMFGSGAVLFGALSLGRLRGLRVERQSLLVVLVAAFVSVPLYSILGPGDREPGVPVIWLAVTALVVPFMGAAADVLEERVLSWASGIPREAAARRPLRERLRGRGWVLLVALVLAGGLSPAGFAVARVREGLPILADADFEALMKGKLAPADAARVTSRLTAVEYSVRRHVGTQDAVAIVARRAKMPRGVNLQVGGDASVDGVSLRPQWIWFLPWTDEPQSFSIALPGKLAPGRHEVALLTSGTLSHDKEFLQARPIEHHFTIEVGPEVSVVKLETAVSLEGTTARLEDNGRWLEFEVTGLPLALSGTLELRDATGLLLAAVPVFARPSREPRSFWLDMPAISGRHELTARVVPDAGPMLAADTELDTILGVPLEAKCVFERE